MFCNFFYKENNPTSCLATGFGKQTSCPFKFHSYTEATNLLSSINVIVVHCRWVYNFLASILVDIKTPQICRNIRSTTIKLHNMHGLQEIWWNMSHHILISNEKHDTIYFISNLEWHSVIYGTNWNLLSGIRSELIFYYLHFLNTKQKIN